MTSASDFNLDPVFALTPDSLIALAAYRTRLSVDAAMRSVATGERIPASAVRAGLIQEFSLDETQLECYLFAGEMLAWDRELSETTPQERTAALTEYLQAAETLLDDSNPGPFDDIHIQVAKQRQEVEQLEEWLQQELRQEEDQD
jgi:hypothetical protein